MKGAASGDDAPANLRIFLVRQTGEALLHLLHLLLEILDIVAAGGGRLARLAGGSRARAGGGLALAAAERREHRKGALEHLHVPPRHLLERTEAGRAERLRHLVAELALLAREGVARDLEIARDQHLHAVAVEADELAQDGDR